MGIWNRCHVSTKKGFGFIAIANQADVHFYAANVTPKCQPGFRRFLLVRFVRRTIRGRDTATKVTAIRSLSSSQTTESMVPMLRGIVTCYDPDLRTGTVSPLLANGRTAPEAFSFRHYITEEFNLGAMTEKKFT